MKRVKRADYPMDRSTIVLVHALCPCVYQRGGGEARADCVFEGIVRYHCEAAE